MKKRNWLFVGTVILSTHIFSATQVLAVEDSEISTTSEVNNLNDLNSIFPESEQWEEDMKNEANNAPVEIDPKAVGRARAGSWSWRDGVICITDSYASSPLFNNGHAGIMGASRWYTTVEANPNDGVQFKSGDWPSRFGGQVWQVGVKSTSVAQDKKAALWAEKQVGKKYNNNFLNRGTRSTFYCSQLVWAAYKDTANVDLDTWRYASAVHPFELHQTDKTTLIYRKK
ncbi:uncharacterized protein YycO [Enterococcus rotai]|uniref:Hydrolase n=1 Tax=Enterococcus rotai TaxID=118060 RepID=A0A0U2NNJ2_9ENTE|nr:YiiX/YebB-like N1pC/P60 family cysteine hydrolase [Enterococcus rotai]ALS36258.1 hypothetical protein ATZ35_03490 [Enterococcus rotai]